MVISPALSGITFPITPNQSLPRYGVNVWMNFFMLLFTSKIYFYYNTQFITPNSLPLRHKFQKQSVSGKPTPQLFGREIAQWKNAFNILWNTKHIIYFWIVQWLEGMLVVLGGHLVIICGGYGLYPCFCQIAYVMRPWFVILRMLCAHKSIF